MSKRPNVRARPEPRDDILHLVIRLGLLALLVYWSFVLLRPFLAIIAWGVILTVALYPIYEWLERKFGGRRALAAICLTLMSLVIVVGPAIWLGAGFIEGLRIISDQLGSTNFAVPPPPDAVKAWPFIGPRLHEFWSLASSNLDSALATLTPQLKPMAKPVLAMAASAGEGILTFLLAVAVMGFFFAPAQQMVHSIKLFLTHVVPERSDEFLALAASTIRSVSQGVIGVAVLQALLAGIGFRLAGVPAASALTFLILFLAIVQVGAQLVLFGVVIWVWMSIDTTPALLFTIYFVVVAFVDNVLKPILMGHGLKTPMLVILIGVLGGTFAHGVVGLFLGPVVLAVVWQLMLAWMRDTASDGVPTGLVTADAKVRGTTSLAGAKP